MSVNWASIPSTEELMEELKGREITMEQARELEEFIHPFAKWE